MKHTGVTVTADVLVDAYEISGMEPKRGSLVGHGTPTLRGCAIHALRAAFREVYEELDSNFLHGVISGFDGNEPHISYQKNRLFRKGFHVGREVHERVLGEESAQERQRELLTV